jgi:hypothetical protein
MLVASSDSAVVPEQEERKMPYIPPGNRPAIDEKVSALAEEIVEDMAKSGKTAEVSVYYREAFVQIAGFVRRLESEAGAAPGSRAEELAAVVVETARGYEQLGAWVGELNYAITRLIQMVPYRMWKRGVWAEPLRYWLHAQTVGALTRAAYELHGREENDYVGNGLAGVLEDVKDELKRRVNTAYEAAQINKSGDCFELVPYRTVLTPFKAGEVEGFIEILQSYQEPE